MNTKFKAQAETTPALRFSAAAEAVLGSKTAVTTNVLSQVTHAMRYQ